MAHRARGIPESVHSAEQAALCELMIAARKKVGLTQQQLATRLGKPQSFVAKYERGERRLDVLEFVAIIQAVGGDPARLLKLLVTKFRPGGVLARR